MSKTRTRRVYLLAVNWDIMDDGGGVTTFMREWQASEAGDVSDWTEMHPASKGWHIYVYTTKRVREQMVQDIIDHWVRDKKVHAQFLQR